MSLFTFLLLLTASVVIGFIWNCIHVSYKKKVRVEQAEYTQRFITHNRKGYNWGTK